MMPRDKYISMPFKNSNDVTSFTPIVATTLNRNKMIFFFFHFK